MNTDAITIKYGTNGILTAEDFVDDGFVLEESLCSESQLVFGSSESAAVEVKIASTAASFVGQTLEVYLGSSLLGKYKVVSDKLASDGETRTLTAYDALYDINGRDVSGWYGSIDWNVIKTLRQFRDSFFDYLGILQKSTTLVNDLMSVSGTMEATSLSGSAVLKAICEINGVFGHIGSNGSFEYIALPPATGAITVGADEVLDSTTEDFTTPAFDSLLIRTEEGDIGGQYPSSGGSHQYIITDNFLCYGKTSGDLQTIAQNASARIFNRSYIPYSAEVECQDGISLGSYVEIETEPNTFSSYVLQRKLEGFAYLTEYLVAQGSAEYVEDVNSTRNQITATAQRINKLTTTLDGTINEVSEIKGDYVSKGVFQTTTDGFEAEVSTINTELQRITDEIDGEAFVYELDYAPTLLNYPAWDFTYNIPCNDTVQTTNDLKFVYNDDFYRKNTRDLAFDTTTSYSYRFVKENGSWGWKMVADSDFGIAMAKIATLEAKDDEISQKVERQEVTINGQGVKITTMEGQLSTQADKIEAKVSKIEGDTTTSCSWDLSTTAFKVRSNGNEVLRVDGNGLNVNGSGTFSGTITSENATITGGSLKVGSKFEVTNDGTLKASNAVFTNTSVDGYATTQDAQGYAGTAETNAKTYVDGKGYQTEAQVTTITENTIKTTDVIAENLTVKAAHIDGKLTADKINVDDLFSKNITATNMNITGGSIAIGTSSETEDKIELKYAPTADIIYHSKLSPSQLSVFSAENDVYNKTEIQSGFARFTNQDDETYDVYSTSLAQYASPEFAITIRENGNRVNGKVTINGAKVLVDSDRKQGSANPIPNTVETVTFSSPMASIPFVYVQINNEIQGQAHTEVLSRTVNGFTYKIVCPDDEQPKITWLAMC